MQTLQTLEEKSNVYNTLGKACERYFELRHSVSFMQTESEFRNLLIETEKTNYSVMRKRLDELIKENKE